MQSKTIGELLSYEREAKGVSLPDLAAKTKIDQEKLEALESNQFEALPASPFVKGYIQAYARVLSLDFKALMAVLRRDYKSSSVGTLVLRTGNHDKHWPIWRSLSLTWQFLAVSGFILALFSYLGLQWYQSQRSPRLVLNQPDNQAVVSSEVLVSGFTDPGALLVVNELPVALNPDGSFNTTLKFAEEGLALIKIESLNEAGRSAVLDRSVFVEF